MKTNSLILFVAIFTFFLGSIVTRQTLEYRLDEKTDVEYLENIEKLLEEIIENQEEQIDLLEAIRDVSR